VHDVRLALGRLQGLVSSAMISSRLAVLSSERVPSELLLTDIDLLSGRRLGLEDLTPRPDGALNAR